MITIPSINDLYTSVKSDLEAEMTISIPVFGKAFLRAISAVQAGKLYISYLHLAKVQKNLWVDTADPAEQGGSLERFGLVKLERLPYAAIAGEYTVQLVGTLGAVVNVNQTFKSDETSANPGNLFILDVDFALDGTNIVTLRSLDPGLDAKLDIGDTLTATSPLNAITDQVTVLTESTAPQAAETFEEYRQKIIQDFRLEPQGGAGSDYRLWSFDAQGVETSYPFAVSGNANEINLFIEATIADSSDGKGTPTAGIIAAVEDAVEDPTIDRPGRLPLTVFEVNYLPIIPKDVDIIIDSYTNLTAAKTTLIETGIENELQNVRPFIGSIDVLANKNDILDHNKIIFEILQAVPGSQFQNITLKVDGVTYTTYTFDGGEIPYLNSVSFT